MPAETITSEADKAERKRRNKLTDYAGILNKIDGMRDDADDDLLYNALCEAYHYVEMEQKEYEELKQYKVKYSILVEYEFFEEAKNVEDAEYKVSERVSGMSLGDFINSNSAENWNEYEIEATEVE